MTNIKPTHRKHNPWHDYSRKCIYHITLVVRDRRALLGNLIEVRNDDSTTICPWKHLHEKGEIWYGKAWMNLTPLGMDVAECIHNMPEYGKKKGLQLRIYAQQVMDTHLHFVLAVEEDMENTVLGDIIRGLKAGCNKAYRKRMRKGAGTMGLLDRTGADDAEGIGTDDAEGTGTDDTKGIGADGSERPGARGTGLFEEDYDETILTRRGQLQRMLDYVHLNPYRKWMKIKNRNCFIPVRGIEIAGRRYDAIGNLMLLGLRRFQVHCRYKWERNNDIEARRAHQNECVVKARQNYALVSPFIMDYEKAVMDFCLKEGHSVIMLMDNGFTDYTTCPGGLFEYCNNGQVLLLVPSELPHVDRKGRIARAECIALNGKAEEIASE